jgi:hypothetical protein
MPERAPPLKAASARPISSLALRTEAVKALFPNRKPPICIGQRKGERRR